MFNKKYYHIFILFSFVYFFQGIHGLAGQSISYYFKEVIHLSASKLMILTSLSTLCWTIKPLYGILSDRFQFFGCYRKSYLIANYGIVFCAMLFVLALPISVFTLILTSIIISFSLAFNDVVIDGSMVSIGNKNGITSTIQALQWGSINLACLVVSIVGAFIAQYFSIKCAFVIVLIPLIVNIIYITLVFKEPEKTKNSESSIIDTCKQFFSKSNIKIFLFLIFLYATPSFATPLFYKMRDILFFDKLTIGYLGAIGCVGAIIGAFIYPTITKKISNIPLLRLNIIIGFFSTLAYLYYNTLTIAYSYSFIFGILGMIGSLNILDLIAQRTPENSEAFTFSGFCSIMNLGSVFSMWIGALLLQVLKLNGLIVLSAIWGLVLYFVIPKGDVK